jgi:hypothetical protein
MNRKSTRADIGFPAIIPPVIKAQDSVKITLDKNLQIASLNAGNCQNLDELVTLLAGSKRKDLFDITIR